MRSLHKSGDCPYSGGRYTTVQGRNTCLPDLPTNGAGGQGLAFVVSEWVKPACCRYDLSILP